jgi:lactoylglutathione lyase
MMTGVRLVVVPVDDQDQAKAFGRPDRLRRHPRPTLRQRALDRGDLARAIRGPGAQLLVPDEPRRQVPEELAQSDLIFTCDDLQQTYQQLTERRMRFPAPPTRMPFGWWSRFEDPDGNGIRVALGQRD